MKLEYSVSCQAACLEHDDPYVPLNFDCKHVES